VNSLVEGRSAEVKRALNDLISKGAQKMVLDVRNLANGNLQEGVSVANLFVGQGVLAQLIGKEGKEDQAFTADPSKVVFTGPLTLVMDRSTAGPAEVIAAAVAAQKRGEIVGFEHSFGAGSDQKLFSLSDGGALLITIDKYAPASGKAFMDEPVNPTVKVDRPVEADVVVPDSEDDDQAEEKPESQAANPTPPAAPAEDIQLKKALEIIKQTPAKSQAAKHAALQDFERRIDGNARYEKKRAA